MIVRLLEQPRAIQLEIVAPLGMPELPRVPEILAELGVQARSTVDHATRSHSVLRTRLVEANGETLDPARISVVLAALGRTIGAHSQVSHAA